MFISINYGEIHGFLIPFHNNFAMGMIGFYMEMIWEHDMEFIWFSMYKLWEWYGCNQAFSQKGVQASWDAPRRKSGRLWTPKLWGKREII
jgi:hypothetical protein